MAFVFPGSAPPQDVPDSVVEEVQNPLMDSTNQASLSWRDGAEQQMSKSMNKSSINNLFPPVHRSTTLPTSRDKNIENVCWMEYDSSNTSLDEATVQQELLKLKGCTYIRRKSDTIWLLQFDSPALAEKNAAKYPLRWASNQESLQNVAHPATITSSETAPNIWLHSPKVPTEEDEEETFGPKPSFWKVLLLWLVGVEEHPARFGQP